MTDSTHSYRAWLIGAPDTELTLTKQNPGTFTFDSAQAPHVEGTLQIVMPDQATLVALDPRLRKRVRVDVMAVFAFGPQVRTFDLGIRERTVNHKAGTVTLALASDEAMATDWAHLTADIYPYALQNSVRALTNYALDLASPGASLAPGGPDYPIHALIASVNVVRNPRAKTNLTDWSSSASISRATSGGPAGCPTYVNVQSAAAGSLLVNYSADGVPIVAGKLYRVSVYQNTNPGVKTAVDALVMNAAGAILLDTGETPQTAPSGWVRRSIYFTAPTGATKVQLRSFTTVSVAAGTSLNTTGWRVSEITPDELDTVYFDDTTPNTTEYAYTYSGETSTRTPLIDRAPDLLTWQGGVSALDFIAPILQMFGLRLVCDELRVWTLRSASYVAPGSLALRYGINLGDAEDILSREDSEWFDAATVRYRWTDPAGIQHERLDTFALVWPHTQVRVFERDTPFPGPGFAEYAVRRAQGRGRQVTVTTVADWRAMTDQPSEYTLPGAPVQVGMTSKITFDLALDEMTVTSRTIDTVLGAIDLLPGVIDALTGTIDNL